MICSQAASLAPQGSKYIIHNTNPGCKQPTQHQGYSLRTCGLHVQTCSKPAAVLGGLVPAVTATTQCSIDRLPFIQVVLNKHWQQRMDVGVRTAVTILAQSDERSLQDVLHPQWAHMREGG